MTSQSCTRVCCEYVAAGEVNECGLGICNLLQSGRWLLNSARCRGWKSSFLSSRTCLGLSNRYSLQRTCWKMCRPKLVSSVSCSVPSRGSFQRFVEALLSTDPASFGCTHFHPLCSVLGSNVGSSLGCNTSSYQPAPRLSLSNISCHAVRTWLLKFYIRLLHFCAND